MDRKGVVVEGEVVLLEGVERGVVLLEGVEEEMVLLEGGEGEVVEEEEGAEKLQPLGEVVVELFSYCP